MIDFTDGIPLDATVQKYYVFLDDLYIESSEPNSLPLDVQMRNAGVNTMSATVLKRMGVLDYVQLKKYKWKGAKPNKQLATILIWNLTRYNKEMMMYDRKSQLVIEPRTYKQKPGVDRHPAKHIKHPENRAVGKTRPDIIKRPVTKVKPKESMNTPEMKEKPTQSVKQSEQSNLIPKPDRDKIRVEVIKEMIAEISERTEALEKELDSIGKRISLNAALIIMLKGKL
jgi:hypothetical protein